ncbi:hypothetical protein [Nocardiopsis aegyptia]|uniref:Uncharacterized protein n=1 Tax=Nocardiopsis aegyptia TaxID=220378 RepID=A0A7Z0EJ88_9ACTN|nr:hypothetical protein [Nocardiopsis aegyptia]NYJ32601.1 hypothetical protein [Nocardiopsis aegyptia]
MDESSSLAEQAATTLVRSMASDDAPVWQVVLERFAALFGRAGHVAAAELERSRDEVVARPDLAVEAAGEWKPKLRRLVAADPGAAARLRALLRDLDDDRPRRDATNRIDGGVAGIAIQAGTIHGGVNRYDGDHVDFSGGTFHDRVVGKEEHHHERTRADGPGDAGERP